MLNKKTKKRFSFLIVLTLFFAEILPLAVQAATVIDPNTVVDNSVNNVPINSAQNDPTGQTNKEQGPKVDVSFSSTGNGQGSKVTASATPSFFNNASDPKKLYFTWYLKRQGCELTDPDGNDKEKKESNETILGRCDFDGDDRITENDWKIAAARIIVQGDFDPDATDEDNDTLVNYNINNYDEKLAGYQAVPEIEKDSGWRKDFLKNGNGEIYETNDEDASNCYVQDPKAGIIYELRRVKELLPSCEDGYKLACAADNQVETCDVLNPEYSQADADAAAAAVPVEEYLIPKTIQSQTGEFCKVSDERAFCEISNYDSRGEPSDINLRNFEASLGCKNGARPMCVKESGNTTQLDADGKITGIVFEEGKMCSSLSPNPNVPAVSAPVPVFLAWNDIVNSDPLLSVWPGQKNPLYSGVEKQSCATTKDKISRSGNDVSGNSTLDSSCTFEKSDNLCKHLFPIVPGSVTGDGKFTLEEKSFWGADPSKPFTNGLKKDEEVVTGLGIDKFSWIFSVGDQVGVVVEGDSAFPTNHPDSSFKRMWAFSNNTCEDLEELGKAKLFSNENGENDSTNSRGFYWEKKGGTFCDPADKSQCIGFLTAEVDLNKCLKENLLDPDVYGLTGLKVELGSSPENPINDSNGKGDVLSIVSGASNLNNLEGLLYKWSVQKSKDGSIPPIDTTQWIDITNDMLEGGSFVDNEKEGLGKRNIDINLNLTDVEDGMNPNSFDGVFYLRIKVRIISTMADGGQNAEGTIIVRIKEQQNKIIAYPVTANNDGMLNFNKGISGQSLELCSGPQGQSRCFVSKNQIIGLEVPDNGNSLSNFAWTINGNKMTCETKISSSCEVNGNKLFVPILGNEGESISVVATALNSKGEAIELRRFFVIAKDQLQILSADANSSCSLQCLDRTSVCPKYLGHYNDLSGNIIPDCSYQVWETREGNNIALTTFGQSGFDWVVDGQTITEFQDKNQMELLIDKPVGASYNIGLSTRLLPDNRNQMNNIRKALYKNWSVSPEDAIEENQSANIQINVVEGVGQIVAIEKQKGFAASLITHLPEQMMFLLKITVASVTMLFAMSLLFALIPESLAREDE